MSMPVIVPGKTTNTQAVNDIITSVALEEKGISHILNAEGEKIQAFVQMPDVTTDQLLAVNASVKATINKLTHLEMVLQSKLELFSDKIKA